MDEATRTLVALSAAIGSGERSAVEAALDRAREAAAPEAIEEALLQSYLFVGFPGALNAMAAWRDRSGRRAGKATGGSREEWRARGEAVCARVYGTQYERLRERVAQLHPDLEAWMLEEGYGKVLARPGLELTVRELCIVALLVAQDAPAQLHAHLRGALNVGASVEDVAEALEIACAAAPPARAQAAREVWAAVRARWEERVDGGQRAPDRAGA
jgi:4-carboxymuconolactone decarboxylase